MYGLIARGAFDAVHFLTDYDGRCENIHGHRWEVTVTIEAPGLGSSGEEASMVMDFSRFKRLVREVLAEWDHTFLVEEGSLADATLAALASEGFTFTVVPFRTTAENMARHLFDRFSAEGLPVACVEVDETPNNRAYYREDPASR